MPEIQQDVRQSFERKGVSNEKSNYGLVGSMFTGLNYVFATDNGH